MDVRCAAFRARRLNAGLVHELLRQDDTYVCDYCTMQNQSNFKQLCRLTFCSDDGISCEPYESRHHGWPHAKRLQSSMPFCDPSGLGASSTARVGFQLLEYRSTENRAAGRPAGVKGTMDGKGQQACDHVRGAWGVSYLLCLRLRACYVSCTRAPSYPTPVLSPS